MSVISTTTLPPKTPMCDYSFARPILGALRGAGIRGVIRYISYSTNGKNLTAPERDALHAAGLGILLVWENLKGDPLSGAALGKDHGAEAAHQATVLGYPKGLPIYAAVDMDTLNGVQTIQIVAYLGEFAKQVQAAGFKCGGYIGSRLWWAARGVFDADPIRPAASSWSPASIMWSPAIRQGNTAVIGGGAVDMDWTTTNVDVWLPRQIPDPPAPGQPLPKTVRQGDRSLVTALVQNRLNVHGYHVQVDGIFGLQTKAAVIAFQKAHRLVADGGVGPQTWPVLLAA